MIRALVDFALNNRFIVLGIALLLFVWGIVSFQNLPVEAYPDVANTWVQVITQWPGRAAEEVEQQVTIPIEIQMNGIPAPSARALGFARRSVGGESDLRRRFRQRLGPPESAGAAFAGDACPRRLRADWA